MEGVETEASEVGTGEEKNKLAKHKYAIVFGYVGTGYSGLQRYAEVSLSHELLHSVTLSSSS